MWSPFGNETEFGNYTVAWRPLPLQRGTFDICQNLALLGPIMVMTVELIALLLLSTLWKSLASRGLCCQAGCFR